VNITRVNAMVARSFLVLALVAVVALSGCGPIDTMKDGFAQSRAVSADLVKSLGLKSYVRFNFFNGQLASVNVTFDGIPSQKSLVEITEASKEAVSAEFKQTPHELIVSFKTQL
jgi:hypothetical protein